MRRSMFAAGVLAGAAFLGLVGAGGLGVASANASTAQPAAQMAWFEDKKAVQRWYHSDTHAGVMGAVGADPEGRDPLQHVADDEGPIMVMATLEFNGPPAIKGSMIPFSMISIELFKPLPGGAYVKDRLAPKGFKIEHMRNLTPKP